jgi:hypothetical protein
MSISYTATDLRLLSIHLVRPRSLTWFIGYTWTVYSPYFRCIRSWFRPGVYIRRSRPITTTLDRDMTDPTEHPCQPPDRSEDVGSDVWVCPDCKTEWWWDNFKSDWARKGDVAPIS